MKKLIDIPEESVKPLKILALENDSSFKSYLEDIIVHRADLDNNFNDLSRNLVNDQQPERAILHYLASCNENIKECTGLLHLEEAFEKENAFYQLVIDCANHLIKNK